jgi:hypothetical protein
LVNEVVTENPQILLKELLLLGFVPTVFSEKSFKLTNDALPLFVLFKTRRHFQQVGSALGYELEELFPVFGQQPFNNLPLSLYVD